MLPTIWNSDLHDDEDLDNYILIVDDDPHVRRVLHELVDFLGVSSQQAADGFEAMDMVHRQPPVLILLDLLLPQMSGLQVLTSLWTSPAMREIPVIVISETGQENRLRLPGVVDIFHKPDIDMARLQSAIKTLLKGTIDEEAAELVADAVPGFAEQFPVI
ncbi:MAG: response regulator [Anaerolineae bacterium]|nr:response regulator [Anaerolineae bacterium]